MLCAYLVLAQYPKTVILIGRILRHTSSMNDNTGLYLRQAQRAVIYLCLELDSEIMWLDSGKVITVIVL